MNDVYSAVDGYRAQDAATILCKMPVLLVRSSFIMVFCWKNIIIVCWNV